MAGFLVLHFGRRRIFPAFNRDIRERNVSRIRRGPGGQKYQYQTSCYRKQRLTAANIGYIAHSHTIR